MSFSEWSGKKKAVVIGVPVVLVMAAFGSAVDSDDPAPETETSATATSTEEETTTEKTKEKKEPVTNDEKIKDMRASTAFTLCEFKARDYLVSPSSADFESITKSRVEQDVNQERWLVRTTVDSENAFGAKLRSDVMCEVTPIDRDNGHVEAIVNQR